MARTKPSPSISDTAHAFTHACASQCAEGLHFSAFHYHVCCIDYVLIVFFDPNSKYLSLGEIVKVVFNLHKVIKTQTVLGSSQPGTVPGNPRDHFLTWSRVYRQLHIYVPYLWQLLLQGTSFVEPLQHLQKMLLQDLKEMSREHFERFAAAMMHPELKEWSDFYKHAQNSCYNSKCT